MLELNKVLMVGTLVADPDTRALASGTSVANFRLAVNRRFRDRSGETQKETVFIDVEAWGRLAEFCQNWLKKGRHVFVEGRLKQDTWEAQDKTKRSRILVNADRVQFADSRPQEHGGDDAGQESRSAGVTRPAQDPVDSPYDAGDSSQPMSTNDDLPF